MNDVAERFTLSGYPDILGRLEGQTVVLAADYEALSQQLAAALAERERAVKWRLADDPPLGTPGLWTGNVIVYTAHSLVLTMAYYNNEPLNGGHWQRPAIMSPRDRVVCWTELPDLAAIAAGGEGDRDARG